MGNLKQRYEEWREQRRLKGLGPLEPGHLATSLKWQRSKSSTDAMPEQWFRQGQWAASFAAQLRLLTCRHAASWITAHKQMPAVMHRAPGKPTRGASVARRELHLVRRES